MDTSNPSLEVDRGCIQTLPSWTVAQAVRVHVSDGSPDPVRFFVGIRGFIEAAAKAAKAEPPRLAVCDEAVALLQAEGQADAAIRFEQLGNDLAKTHEVDILCAYSLSSFNGRDDDHVFQNICAEHSAMHSQ